MCMLPVRLISHYISVSHLPLKSILCEKENLIAELPSNYVTFWEAPTMSEALS